MERVNTACPALERHCRSLSCREHRVERVNTGTAGACPAENTQWVNTGTAGACPAGHRVERVNTGTAGACPAENTGWRGLTLSCTAGQAPACSCRSCVLCRQHRVERVNTGTAGTCPAGQAPAVPVLTLSTLCSLQDKRGRGLTHCRRLRENTAPGEG